MLSGVANEPFSETEANAFSGDGGQWLAQLCWTLWTRQLHRTRRLADNSFILRERQYSLKPNFMVLRNRRKPASGMRASVRTQTAGQTPSTGLRHPSFNHCNNKSSHYSSWHLECKGGKKYLKNKNVCIDNSKCPLGDQSGGKADCMSWQSNKISSTECFLCKAHNIFGHFYFDSVEKSVYQSRHRPCLVTVFKTG